MASMPWRLMIEVKSYFMLGPRAKRIGSVGVIVHQDGRLRHGFGLNLAGAQTPQWLPLRLVDIRHGQLRSVDRERYVEPSIGQVVDAIGLVFAASTARILAKDLD